MRSLPDNMRQEALRRSGVEASKRPDDSERGSASRSAPLSSRRVRVVNPRSASTLQRCTASRSERAFTLLEMILAVAVAAIVLAVISGAFFTALHLQESTENAVDSALPVDQALSVLRRDLACVVPPTNGTDKVLSGSFRVGTLTSQGVSQPVAIEMFTATGALNSDPSQPWGDIQKVAYGLQTPADRTAPGLDLIRSVTRNLLSTATPDVKQQWLLGGVQSIRFSCFDGTQWLDTWDTSDPTTADTNLPLAVRVEIQMAGDNASPIEMLVPIDAQSLTNATVSGGTTVSGGVMGGSP